MSRFSDSLRALGDGLRVAAEWLPSQLDPRDVAICTIHGNSASYGGDFAKRHPWPELQIEQLRRHTRPGYRVFAYGNDLIPEHEQYLRDCLEVEFISSADTRWGTYTHVWPLRNWLARIAMQKYRWIVHLDSDAFPVSDGWLESSVERISYQSPMVAVRRVENGDHHSDRSFLVYSRAGYRRHAFDFSKINRVDSGAGISAELEASGFAWSAMLRSNTYDYHPLIAGIYDDLIYHHAAGSREPKFRFNKDQRRDETHWIREQAIHRVLMRRAFDHTDALIAELRGEREPVDLEVVISAELEAGS